MQVAPILQQLSGKTALNPMLQAILPQINQYKGMFNMLRHSNNPQMMLQQLLRNNPNYKQIEQLINNANGDPQRAFYGFCEQVGINPQEFIDALK